MNKALRNRLMKLAEEEREQDTNTVLLDTLRVLATRESIIPELPASERNALNAFFTEIKSMMFSEFVLGEYGSEIIVEMGIVLAFEVGYGLKEQETSS